MRTRPLAKLPSPSALSSFGGVAGPEVGLVKACTSPVLQTSVGFLPAGAGCRGPDQRWCLGIVNDERSTQSGGNDVRLELGGTPVQLLRVA